MKNILITAALILISAFFVKSPLLAENGSFPYYTLGISIGTPSLINAHAGIYGQRFGAQCTMSAIQAALLHNNSSSSALDLPGYWAQFNLEYAALSSESFLLSLNIQIYKKAGLKKRCIVFFRI